METINDYVKWVAASMGIALSDDKLEAVASVLVQSEDYKSMLDELEGLILKANEIK